MTRHAWRLVAPAGALLLGLAGCAPGAEADSADAGQGFPRTVENCGREIVLESEPENVLTIGSSALNYLAAAGAGDRIVARSGEFYVEEPDWASEAVAGAENITPEDPGTEQVLGTGADLVVHSGLFATTYEDLQGAGVPSLVTAGDCLHAGADIGEPPVDFSTINQQILEYGDLFGTQEAAAANVEANEAVLDEATAQAADLPERTAAALYYFGDGAPLSAYGGIGIINTQFEITNLSNVFATEETDFFDVSRESVLDADPDVLVVVYGFSGEDFEEASERLLAEPGFEELTAAREGALVGMRSDSTVNNPEAFAGLASLAEQLAELD
ncbi:ABC transporter substrate-binding protein [Sediminivirga luteola]|uniref:ABC transporter substrate-binding protein n=1 Tax=Sediminivirga luteola TaxID=1774748 RepID=UPI001F56A400|nr:ABC transporter substrate-binding protein [Sediminivirga luteola]MCI2266790.1 ABC transporter substrate-binding protein [Sediminivirga luteola]